MRDGELASSQSQGYHQLWCPCYMCFEQSVNDPVSQHIHLHYMHWQTLVPCRALVDAISSRSVSTPARLADGKLVRAAPFFLQLCVIGEHTDWAAGYRHENRAIPPSFTLVATTDEGLHARVGGRTDGRLVFRASRAAPCVGSEDDGSGLAMPPLNVAMTEEVKDYERCFFVRSRHTKPVLRTTTSQAQWPVVSVSITQITLDHVVVDAVEA